MGSHPATQPDDRRGLIERHLPLVWAAVTYYHQRHPEWDVDDMRGAGYLALCQAAQRWRDDTGVTFGRYCRSRVHGAIMDLYSRAGRVVYCEVPDQPGGVPADIEIERTEAAGAVLTLVSALPRRERAVIRARLRGWPASRTGRYLRPQVSEDRVWQIQREAIQRMRAMV